MSYYSKDGAVHKVLSTGAGSAYPYQCASSDIMSRFQRASAVAPALTSDQRNFFIQMSR